MLIGSALSFFILHVTSASSTSQYRRAYYDTMLQHVEARTSYVEYRESYAARHCLIDIR